MTVALATQAELLRLGRTLGVDADRLAFLADAAEPDLRRLRQAISEALYAADRDRFERIAALAARLPPPLAARLAERTLDARMAARAVALIEPRTVGAMAQHLPLDYIADVAAASDVGRVGPLLGDMRPAQVREVARELARRREWVSMGAFVGHVEGAALAAAVDTLDGEQLLRIGFVIEDKDRVDAVLALLGDAQLARVLAAADRHDLWPEAVDLATHASRPQLARLAAALGDAPLARLAAALRDDAALAAAAAPLLADAPASVRNAIGDP